MNNFFKSVLCLLTTVSVSSSGFCSGSNIFGVGLLLGTAKSKISSEYINKLKQECRSNFIQDLNIESQDYTIKSNALNEKLKFRVDTGIIAFYQHNFNDVFFTRIGALGNFSVARNTSSIGILNENVSSTKLKLPYINVKADLELKHSFDLGGQLSIGLNLAQTFSIVIGGELGYTKGEVRANITANNEKIFETGTYSFGSFFYGAVGGVEFNFNNVIVGVHGFFHSAKLKDSSFKSKDSYFEIEDNTQKNKNKNSFKLNNIGVRLMVAYKF